MSAPREENSMDARLIRVMQQREEDLIQSFKIGLSDGGPSGRAGAFAGLGGSTTTSESIFTDELVSITTINHVVVNLDTNSNFYIQKVSGNASMSLTIDLTTPRSGLLDRIFTATSAVNFATIIAKFAVEVLSGTLTSVLFRVVNTPPAPTGILEEPRTPEARPTGLLTTDGSRGDILYFKTTLSPLPRSPYYTLRANPDTAPTI